MNILEITLGVIKGRKGRPTHIGYIIKAVYLIEKVSPRWIHNQVKSYVEQGILENPSKNKYVLAEVQCKLVEKSSPKPFTVSKPRSASAVSRDNLEMECLAKLSVNNRARYRAFWDISRNLNTLFVGGTAFDVDHANSIDEFGEEAIHPDNLQILSSTRNRQKGSTSEARMSFETQVVHIHRVINVVNKGVDLTEDQQALLTLSLNLLRLVY